jgi:head-tail adaptor
MSQRGFCGAAGAITALVLVSLVAMPLPALAQDAAKDGPKLVDLFVDRGDTFIRAGSAQGIKVGDSIPILGDKIGNTEERRVVGSAAVLEVWKTIARVNLDAGARGAEGEKFAQVGAETATSKTSSSLRGRASASGVAKLRRITIYNDSGSTWRNCDVRLPNNKRYILTQLAPRSSEGIMLFRFNQDGVERDLPTTYVDVRCSNGEARFPLAM